MAQAGVRLDEGARRLAGGSASGAVDDRRCWGIGHFVDDLLSGDDDSDELEGCPDPKGVEEDVTGSAVEVADGRAKYRRDGCFNLVWKNRLGNTESWGIEERTLFSR